MPSSLPADVSLCPFYVPAPVDAGTASARKRAGRTGALSAQPSTFAYTCTLVRHPAQNDSCHIARARHDELGRMCLTLSSATRLASLPDRLDKVQKRASNVMKLAEQNERLKAELRAMTERLEAAERRQRELAQAQAQGKGSGAGSGAQAQGQGTAGEGAGGAH